MYKQKHAYGETAVLSEPFTQPQAYVQLMILAGGMVGDMVETGEIVKPVRTPDLDELYTRLESRVTPAACLLIKSASATGLQKQLDALQDTCPALPDKLGLMLTADQNDDCYQQLGTRLCVPPFLFPLTFTSMCFQKHFHLTLFLAL